jgi:hypothetical protein
MLVQVVNALFAARQQKILCVSFFAVQRHRLYGNMLGLNHLIEELLVEDRSGSVVLESIFRRKQSTLQGFNIGTSETVAIAS